MTTTNNKLREALDVLKSVKAQCGSEHDLSDAIRMLEALAQQAAPTPQGYCCYGGLRSRQDCASCAKWIPAPLSASPAAPEAAKPEPLEKLTRLTEELGLYPWQEKPLTEEQIKRMIDATEANNPSWICGYKQGVLDAESAHCIGKDKAS